MACPGRPRRRRHALGVGKTTVATGLMAALRRHGDRVAPAKVGPDFIDPSYHALATGRPGRNLDAWICGEGRIAPLAAKAAIGADVLVVEGVMGLFDGAAEPENPASTAHVARLLDAPVVLVVDASAMSGSVAALVHGYATFDPAVRIAGVVLNRVGSRAHESMLREALEPIGIPVLGVLARADELAWRDRHLGLVPVVEQREAVEKSLERLADAVDASCDLDAISAVARAAPPLAAREARPPGCRAGPRRRRRRARSASRTGQSRAARAGGRRARPVRPAPTLRFPPGSMPYTRAAASPRCSSRTSRPTNPCSPTCALRWGMDS
jgi:cobyrinic acid a,c-diamide synthase